MKTHPVPKVGDTVRLNDFGVAQCFNVGPGRLSHMKTLEMTVTQIDSQSATYPQPTYPLEVDNPEINQFLIDHLCFDIVSPSARPIPKCRICGTTEGRLVHYQQGPCCDGPDCVAF